MDDENKDPNSSRNFDWDNSMRLNKDKFKKDEERVKREMDKKDWEEKFNRNR